MVPGENPRHGQLASAGGGGKETGAPFRGPVRPIETPAPEVPLPASAGLEQSADTGTGARVSPELPYPEAPLASRKAPDEDFSTRAENQAEALAVERHQERKHAARLSERGEESGTRPRRLPQHPGTSASVRAEPRSESLADPKPPPRYIDPEVLRAFHDTQPDCLTCGYYRVSAHHLVSRAQGGDDVAENLIPLCGLCHGALHSGGKWQAYGVSRTAEQVRNGIGGFLMSGAGDDHLRYVTRKLGTGAAAFLSRYGVED